MCNYRQICGSCGHLSLPADTEQNLSYTSYCDLPDASHQKFCRKPTILKRTHDVKVPCINCIPALRGWKNAVPWATKPYTMPGDEVDKKADTTEAKKDDINPTQGSRPKARKAVKLRETTNLETTKPLPLTRKRKRIPGSNGSDGAEETSSDVAAKKRRIQDSGWTPVKASGNSRGFCRVSPKIRGPPEPLYRPPPWKMIGILALKTLSRETVGVPELSQSVSASDFDEASESTSSS